MVVSHGVLLGAAGHDLDEDEPIVFPSSVPLHFASRFAQEHVKVVTAGEGADDLFSGYARYQMTAWNERLRRSYRRSMCARGTDGNTEQ